MQKMYMMSYWWGYTPFGWMGGIMMLLWWALVVAGIAWFARWIMKQGGGKSATDILKERYAKGEIDAKEYERMKKEIE